MRQQDFPLLSSLHAHPNKMTHHQLTGLPNHHHHLASTTHHVKPSTSRQRPPHRAPHITSMTMTATPHCVPPPSSTFVAPLSLLPPPLRNINIIIYICTLIMYYT